MEKVIIIIHQVILLYRMMVISCSGIKRFCGQGGSEILDELLGYKSLNIRKSLTKYKSTTNNLKVKRVGEKLILLHLIGNKIIKVYL